LVTVAPDGTKPVKVPLGDGCLLSENEIITGFNLLISRARRGSDKTVRIAGAEEECIGRRW
jgi:hypothetical protein